MRNNVNTNNKITNLNKTKRRVITSVNIFHNCIFIAKKPVLRQSAIYKVANYLKLEIL